MTCRDAIDVLAEFLDQTLSHEAGEALEAHFRDCPRVGPTSAPIERREGWWGGGPGRDAPEVRARLRQFLIDQLNA